MAIPIIVLNPRKLYLELFFPLTISKIQFDAGTDDLSCPQQCCPKFLSTNKTPGALFPNFSTSLTIHCVVNNFASPSKSTKKCFTKHHII